MFKSMEDLWEANERKPLKVISENKTVVTMIGCACGKAYGWVDDHGPNCVQTFELKRVHWQIYKDPEPVPHWQAVRLKQGNNTEYVLSGTLYYCEEQAQNGLGKYFVKLAKEIPGIVMIPTQWQKRNPRDGY